MTRNSLGLVVLSLALAACSTAGTPLLTFVAPRAEEVSFLAAGQSLAVGLHGGCAGARQTSLRITQGGTVVAEIAAVDGQVAETAAVPVDKLSLHGLPAEVRLAAHLECDSGFAADAPETVFKVFPIARDVFETPADTSVVPLAGGRFLACGFSTTTLLAGDGHPLAEVPSRIDCGVEATGNLLVAQVASTLGPTVPPHSLVFDATLKLLWNGETLDPNAPSTALSPGQGLAFAVGGRLIAYPPGYPVTVVELDPATGAVLSTLTFPTPEGLRELTPIGRPWSLDGTIGLLLRVNDAASLRYVMMQVDFGAATATATEKSIATLPRGADGAPLLDSSAVMAGEKTALIIEEALPGRASVEVKALDLGTHALTSVSVLASVTKTWRLKGRVAFLVNKEGAGAELKIVDETHVVGGITLDAGQAPPRAISADPTGGLLLTSAAAPFTFTWYDAAFTRVTALDAAPHFGEHGTLFLQSTSAAGSPGRLMELQTAAQYLELQK